MALLESPRSSRTGLLSRVGVLGVLALTVAACADGGAVTRTDTPGSVDASETAGSLAPGAGGEVFASATVLEARGAGPQLCLGGVAESLPPQCGGPVITNWDWAEVRGAARRGGTTWGSYVVVGTYDGTRFTLTRPAATIEEYDGPPLPQQDDRSLRSPCPEPDGGWRVVDEALTTQASLDRTVAAAARLEGYADLWVDQSINDADPAEEPEAMNDPRKLVLNVRVVDDVAAAEATLRETWGGALCVSKALRTAAELQTIQQEVGSLEGMLFSSSGQDVVDVGVIHDDGSLQQELDERYGPGVVRVQSALQPYPG